MKKNITAYLQLTMGMFLAGSTVIAGKYVMDIPIFLSQAVSIIFSMLILFPTAHFKEGPLTKVKLLASDRRLLFLQAVTGLFLFRIFILLGLRYTTAVASGIVMSTTPIVLALFGAVFLKEKIHKQSIIGIVIGTAGILFINTYGRGELGLGGAWPLIGNGFIFLAVIGEVLFTILRKKQSFSDRPITASAFIMLFAFLLFCIPAFYQAFYFDWKALDGVKLAALLYYGIFGSAAAYICWLSGIEKVKVSTAAGFSGIMPVSSVMLALFVLKEKIVWQYVLGLILIIVSIYVIIKKDTKLGNMAANAEGF